MRNDTREMFDSYARRIAELSGVQAADQMFSVAPSVQQTMERTAQETSDFLKEINVIGVDQMTGQRVGVGLSGPIAKRTDLDKEDAEREPVSVTRLNEDGYECARVEFDTALPWSQLDAWAQRGPFQSIVRDATLRRQSLDRIMIGFNGTTAAVESDQDANPQLQDVNLGWLQQYREKAPERVLSEGSTPGVIRVGPGGDYANLDALIFDAVNELIDPWHRETLDLTAISAHDLMADKYFEVLSKNGDTPTEMLAADTDMQKGNARFGGVAPSRVPYVPEGTILITPPSNLSIYYQRGKRRRLMADNPKRSRVENYESSNEAYVIEDFGAGCLIENVELGNWL